MTQQTSMTIEQCKELMPKWLGQPMYMGGIPVRPENYSYEGATMMEILFRYSEPDSRRQDDENMLIAWVLYYINSPIFNMDGELTEELREKASKITSFEELLKLCLDYGIDPF